MTFTHVLVPTDLSSMAPHRVRCACEEAERHHARMTFLHVVASRPETTVYYIPAMPSPSLRFDPILGGPLAVPQPPPPMMILHDPQEEALQRLRELIPASCYCDCETVVATGNPVALIVHMARTRAVDLIVMGTHGYSGLRHILWGSVAEKVIRLAPCPVLVVRHPGEIDQTTMTTTSSQYSIAS